MESTCNVTSRFQSDLFLIKFQFVFGTNIVTNEHILDILKSNEGKGISELKRFDYSKQKFFKISAKDFLNIISFNSELFYYCTNHSYFRNVKF